MAKINPDWGKCIRELLEEHNLTYRAAMIKGAGVVSHTSIKDWSDGIIPSDFSKAIRFLEAFPREEAIKCVEAAGETVPDHWIKDPVKRVEFALEGQDHLEEWQIDAIKRLAEQLRKKKE